MARTIMIQGTGSNVGKSVLVAGLCRAFRARGLTVRPFKPQNMSNNAAVTREGGEIGRAQALQARACGVEPSTLMNPVLLKPESETGAQVILRGERLTTARAADYRDLKPQLLSACLESFEALKSQADLVIIEGAGSPAEVNLRAGDIANMGFARAANVPVILTGDIDRGGVIAQLVGTKAVIDPEDAAMIQGFLVNKFRGDPALFTDGRDFIAKRTGWRDFGTIPWFMEAARLPAEDAADLSALSPAAGGELKIAVPCLPRIANFDDLDPLRLEQGVSVVMVRAGEPLPGDADLVIIPGSKSTIADLAAFRTEGWDIDLFAHIRRGGHVLGLCGGYQMLGRVIRDPDGIEGPKGGAARGLAALDVDTVLTPEKRLVISEGRHFGSGAAVSGYEIHVGRTVGPDTARAPFMIEGKMEGASSANGRVVGTYLHGLFAADAFRAAFLGGFGAGSSIAYDAEVDAVLDRLAAHLEAHTDIERMLEIAGQ